MHTLIRILPVLLCIVLAACVTGPQRKATSGAVADAIEVYPPNGPAGPMPGLLAQSVRDALLRRGYTAHVAVQTGSNSIASFVLKGRAEPLGPRHAPTVAALYWVLEDGNGKEIAFLSQGVRGSPDAWTYGSPAILRTVGEETAANMLPFLGEPTNAVAPPSQAIKSIFADDALQTAQVPPPPAPPPLLPSAGENGVRPFGLWVDEISGAPGDGNAALKRALLRLLERNNLPFAMTAGLASHYVQGVVDVVPGDNVSEHVTIIWIVSNAAGKEIGRTTQHNEIVRGSLHQAWGDTAIYAAQGGFDGIYAILEHDLGQSPVP